MGDCDITLNDRRYGPASKGILDIVVTIDVLARKGEEDGARLCLPRVDDRRDRHRKVTGTHAVERLYEVSDLKLPYHCLRSLNLMPYCAATASVGGIPKSTNSRAATR